MCYFLKRKWQKKLINFFFCRTDNFWMHDYILIWNSLGILTKTDTKQMKFSCSLIWQVFFMHSKSRTTLKISILYNIFRQHIFCHLLKIWVDCHFFKLLLSFLIDGSQLVVHIPFFKKKKTTVAFENDK